MDHSQLQIRVLIADRQSSVNEFVGRVLASPSWVVSSIDSEVSLFSAIADQRHDVLLLHANIADSSLKDLCSKLISAFGDARPSIILVVGQDQRAMIPIGFECGVDDCLSVPFYPEELLARVLVPWRLRQLENNAVNQRQGGEPTPEIARINSRQLLKQLDQANLLRNYLSPVLVESVVSSNPSTPFGSVAKRKRITFMFLDIRDFTQMADDLPPETVSDVLSEYFTHVQDIVFKHGGSINKFLGDGLLVIFGDPMPDKHHKLKAMMAGLEIRAFIDEFTARLHFLPMPFNIGIGINSGKATVGNFGTHTQIDYTAVGPAVNLAARIQGLARNGQVVVSQETYEDYRDDVEIVNERQEMVKGVKTPVTVGEVVRLCHQKT